MNLVNNFHGGVAFDLHITVYEPSGFIYHMTSKILAARLIFILALLSLAYIILHIPFENLIIPIIIWPTVNRVLNNLERMQIIFNHILSS